MATKLEWIERGFAPVVTVATAAMVAWLNFYGSQAEHALKVQVSRLEQQVNESADQRAERESLQKFQMDIYKLVLESVKSRDPREQEAAQAFIVVMVDEPLRTNFLRVLNEGADPAVKPEIQRVLAQEAKFKSEAPKLTRAEPPPDPGARASIADWDFDLFWCESSGASGAEAQAKKVQSALESSGAKGRIRVRVLPESINAKSGYRVAGYQVRFNEGEQQTADALRDLAERTLPGNSFEQRRSGQPTAWYLSAFFCP